MKKSSQIQIAFFEIEKWEKEYLEKELKKVFPKKLKLYFYQTPLSVKKIKKIKNIQILGVFIYSKVDKNILIKLPNLKFIVTMSTGFDHIDLKECKKRKILVSNTPYYGENTVAEYTFALILALSRKLIESTLRTKRGNFSLKGLRGFDLKGKTIGIIGFGHIGTQVAKIAQGFGMKVIAYDIKKDLKRSQKLKVKYVSFDYLLKNSDIISLHAPYNRSTHHMINKNTIKKIKKGAILINTARGGLIETESLILALKKGILKGVGLDVLEEECFLKEEKELLKKEFWKKCEMKTLLQNHFLLFHPKVIITPHNAFNSKEALIRILEITVKNIKKFLEGKPINLIVKKS